MSTIVTAENFKSVIEKATAELHTKWTTKVKPTEYLPAPLMEVYLQAKQVGGCQTNKLMKLLDAMFNVTMPDPRNLTRFQLTYDQDRTKAEAGNIPLQKFACIVPLECNNSHNYPLNLPVVVKSAANSICIDMVGRMGNHIGHKDNNEVRIATPAEIQTFCTAVQLFPAALEKVLHRLNS